MKKVYGIVLACFLLCIAVFTYISDQIYKDNLPKVRIEAAVSTNLRYQWDLTGTVHYDSPTRYSFPFPVRITQTMVQVGDWVDEKTPLFQLDKDYLHEQWLHSKIEEESLLEKTEIAESYTKDLLQLQLQETQDVIQQIECLVAEEGWVYASSAGVIMLVNDATMVSAEGPLVTIGEGSGDKKLLLSLTDQQAKYCTEGKRLDVELIRSEGKTVSSLSIERVFYNSVLQCYQCTIPLTEPIYMVDGQRVNTKLLGISGTYETVIPLSAVHEIENGNVTYFVLREKTTSLGTEYYVVQQSSVVLDQNEQYLALASSLTEPLVIPISGSLTNGCAVRIIP